jgi:hypothetical protein
MKFGIEGAIVGGVVGVVSAIAYTWWSKRKRARECEHEYVPRPGRFFNFSINIRLFY